MVVQQLSGIGAMSRCITTLPLPHTLLMRFQELGYTFCEDICLSPQGSGCSHKADSGVEEEVDKNTSSDGLNWADNGTAFEVLKQWSDDPCKNWKTLITPPIPSSALKLLQKECQLGIPTFSKSLDDFLSGGVPVCSVTELSGAPGAGKTQLCLQLCVSVQIPCAFHGLEGQAVYIDTDRGFSISRLSEIAEGCVDRLTMIARNCGKSDTIASLETFSSSSIMKNIFYMYCPKYIDLIAVIVYLKNLLQENKKIKLIVIDSLIFAFHEAKSSLQKVQELYRLLGTLQGLALNNDLAVVVTNHLTTKLEPGKESTLIPALGDSFGHRLNLRLMLAHIKQDDFVCVPIKNGHKNVSSIFFKVTRSGISDT